MPDKREVRAFAFAVGAVAVAMLISLVMSDDVSPGDVAFNIVVAALCAALVLMIMRRSDGPPGRS